MRSACLVLAVLLAATIGAPTAVDGLRLETTAARQVGTPTAMSPAALAARLEQELAAARVPGAAIAIVSGGERFAGSYGVANAESRVPMTPTTLLQTGSLTKLFTALAVCATLESRQVQLEAPIGRHLSGLAPGIARLTFHQLLAQIGGLRDRPGTSGADDEAALAAAARALGPADMMLPPGTVFSYSNPGYALVGAALEAVRRQPYADALADAALGPLGMMSSSPRPEAVRARAHAIGHRLDGPSVVALPTPVNDTRLWPAGYLWSNATDLSHALAALLHEGRVAGHAGLPASVVRRVGHPHTPMPNVFVGGHYGYGLMVARDRGALVHEHGGTMPGFSSILRLAPERRLGLAILTNLDNAPLRRIAQVVMADALELPALPSPARSDTPVTAAEMKGLLGRYENRGAIDLIERDGSVAISIDGGPAMAVSRLGANRFLARPAPEIAGPEFVVQAAANGAPYLHFALWAYAKH
jgi:CubicO group peptidase (beta-lactamase class C family)